MSLTNDNSIDQPGFIPKHTRRVGANFVIGEKHQKWLNWWIGFISTASKNLQTHFIHIQCYSSTNRVIDLWDNGLLGVTFRGALWHGYSCSWTPAALCGEHLLTFFLPKVDIEWRNLCSIYSSNKAEHISEKIFQFYVVLWLSDVISFTLNVRH